MPIGQLRDRVTIEQPTTTTVGGGRTVAWTTLATVWASVTPGQVGEALQAYGVNAKVAYQVEMRYRADVAPTMRLTWRPYLAAVAKPLEIFGVVPVDGGRDRILVTCGERA